MTVATGECRYWFSGLGLRFRLRFGFRFGFGFNHRFRKSNRQRNLRHCTEVETNIVSAVRRQCNPVKSNTINLTVLLGNRFHARTAQICVDISCTRQRNAKLNIFIPFRHHFIDNLRIKVNERIGMIYNIERIRDRCRIFRINGFARREFYIIFVIRNLTVATSECSYWLLLFFKFQRKQEAIHRLYDVECFKTFSAIVITRIKVKRHVAAYKRFQAQFANYSRHIGITRRCRLTIAVFCRQVLAEMLTSFCVHHNRQRLIAVVEVILQQFLSYNNRIVTAGVYVREDVYAAFFIIRIVQITLEISRRIFYVKFRIGHNPLET